jgi:hypothetical protein
VGRRLPQRQREGRGRVEQVESAVGAVDAERLREPRRPASESAATPTQFETANPASTTIEPTSPVPTHSSTNPRVTAAMADQCAGVSRSCRSRAEVTAVTGRDVAMAAWAR